MASRASLDPHNFQDALDELMEADEPFELPFEPKETPRGTADAAFVLALLSLLDRYGEPDYPRRRANLEPVEDAEGSPMAVWDLEDFELALYVRPTGKAFGVWLTRD